MQSTTLEQLSAADAQVILEHLPERIRAALIARAADIEYPIEAVVEMAICRPHAIAFASFLDGEALGAC